jgi:hypothetical protein
MAYVDVNIVCRVGEDQPTFSQLRFAFLPLPSEAATYFTMHKILRLRPHSQAKRNGGCAEPAQSDFVKKSPKHNYDA